MIDHRNEVRHHAHAGGARDHEHVAGLGRPNHSNRQTKREDGGHHHQMPNPLVRHQTLRNPAIDRVPCRILQHGRREGQINCK